jgi:hypothetical protein
MKKYIYTAAIAAVFFTLLIPGTVTGHIKRAWASPTPPLPKYNLVMVLAMAPPDFAHMARMQEDNLVNKLNSTGIKAIADNAVNDTGYIMTSNADKVIEPIKRAGVDCVIIILLLDKTSDQDSFFTLLRNFWPLL